jgi:serine/threonine protein phosphatase PrpC
MAALYGADHPDLDRVADATVGDAMAIALSRGRFPKGYDHVDPNEDAVLAAEGAGGRLLVAADGHNGVEAAHGAVRAIEQTAATVLDSPHGDPEGAVDDLFSRASHGVVQALQGVPDIRTQSRTALSVVLITGNALYTATSGDTAVLLMRGGRKGKVVSGKGPFLGPRTPLPEVTRTKVRDGDIVVAVSDGVTDYLGIRWVHAATACLLQTRNAHEAALALVEAAMAGGAGDNIAAAVAEV